MNRHNQTGFKFSIEKIQGAYEATLEELIRLLCGLVAKLCEEDIISTTDISQLNKLHSQLKYHEKMKNVQDEDPLNRHVQKALIQLKTLNDEFPKIKQMQSNYKTSLATIAEKYSEENLLSNYLRKNHSNRKKLTQAERHSETLNLNSNVYREQTRRSLDEPTSAARKSIYNELEKLNKKQPVAKKQLPDYGRKFIIKSKLPNYTISKLI